MSDAALHGADDATIDELIDAARKLHNPAKDGSIYAVDAHERELATMPFLPVPWEEREAFTKATEGMGYVQRSRAWCRRFRPEGIAFEALFSAYRWHPAHRLASLASSDAFFAARMHRIALRNPLNGRLMVPTGRLGDLPVGGRARELASELVNNGFDESLAVFLLSLGREAETLKIPKQRAPGYLFAPWLTDAQHAVLREVLKRKPDPGRDAVSQNPYGFTFPRTHQGITQRDVKRLADEHGVSDLQPWLKEAEEMNAAARAKAKATVAELIADGLRDELQIAFRASCDLNLVRTALRAAKKPGSPASRRTRGVPARFTEDDEQRAADTKTPRQ